MRRPLCLACLAYVVVVMLLLYLIPPPHASTDAWEGKTVILTGQVEHKSLKDQVYTVELSHITLDSGDTHLSINQPVHTNDIEGVLCYLEGVENPKLGSYIQVRGKLTSFESATNDGEFDRRRYYKVRRLSAQMQSATLLAFGTTYHRQAEYLYQLRSRLASIYDKTFTPKNASIMKAMLLGDKAELDRETKNLYQRNGIAHILAISGLHISIIGMGIYHLLRKIRVPLLPAVAFCVALMYYYGMMIGAGSSSYRAIFMFVIHLTAHVCRRTYDMITAMAMAAVCILLEQPLYVFDTGFQLSFSAILAIGLVSPIFQYHFPSKIPLVTALFASASISLTSMPILLSSFYELPCFALFLNLLVIPMMTVLLLCGLIILPIQAIGCSVVINSIVGFPCSAILRIYEYLCLLVERLPNHTWIIGKPSVSAILCFYLGLILLACFYDKLSKGLVLFGVVMMCAILTFHPRDDLKITMLDVGQGDCFCIESETGHTYLIDGGSSSKGKVGQYQIIPFLKAQGIDSLDAVFVTHSDSDHVSGIEELLEQTQKGNGIKVKILILPDILQPDTAFCALEELAKKCEVPIRYLSKGDQIRDGRLQMTCLHPTDTFIQEDANAYSCVLSLSYGSFDALFTGDVEGSGEAALILELQKLQSQGELPDYELFKVAHHGSQYTNSNAILELCQFDRAFISCGKNNRYGHPHEAVIQRLKQAGIPFWTTSEEGAVSIKIRLPFRGQATIIEE
ncbi:MAG: DNA internalization-related competence protein ComEC/Rec2 [Lachnospiraceae bacterium]